MRPRDLGGNDWSGFHIGISGNIIATDGTYKSFDLDRAAAQDFVRSDSSDGKSIGFVAGYKWQRELLVYGVVVSAYQGGGKIDFVDNYAPPDKWRYAQELSPLASVTGRVGYSFGSTLVYGLAGVAYGKVTISGYDTSVDPSGGSMSNWQQGWTYGFGIEHKLNDNWSTSLEYRQTNLNTVTHKPDYWFKPFRDSHDVQHRKAAVGLNYHF